MRLFRKRNQEEIFQLKKNHDSFIQAYDELLIELFADRGMLLGSTRYSEMTGVERYDALNEIDRRIIETKERIKKEGETYQKNLKLL